MKILELKIDTIAYLIIILILVTFVHWPLNYFFNNYGWQAAFPMKIGQFLVKDFLATYKIRSFTKNKLKIFVTIKIVFSIQYVSLFMRKWRIIKIILND